MLTPKQEKFVQGLFSGLSQREAYKQAYNAVNMKDTTIHYINQSYVVHKQKPCHALSGTLSAW